MQLLNQAVVTEHLNMQAAIDAIEAMLHQQAVHPEWVKAPERLVIETFSEDDKHSSGSHYRCQRRFMRGKKNILP